MPVRLVAVGPGAGAAKGHRAVGARHLVHGFVRAGLDPPRHHVDDRRQPRVEQHVERAVQIAHAGNATHRSTDYVGTTFQIAPVPLLPSVTT